MDSRIGTVAVPERSSKNAACDPCEDENCCCNSPGSSRSKTVVFWSVILLAVGVAAYSFVKKPNALADSTSQPDVSAANEVVTSAGLATINLPDSEAVERLSADRDITFLLVPGKDASATKAASDQVVLAIGKLVAQRQKVAAFALDQNAQAYQGVASRYGISSWPCILVVGNGGQPTAVSGDITETKLFRAAIAAMARGNCCPGGSCCPATSQCSGPACSPSASAVNNSSLR